MRPYFAILLLAAACTESHKSKPESDSEPEEKTPRSAKPKRSASASAAPAASGGVAIAKGFTERVCACKDAACGQKVLDEARETMPAVAQAASPTERTTIDDERKKAFACMDVLAANDPAEKKAVEAVTAFSKTVCACTDAACVDAALRDGKKAYDDANATSVSKAGSGTMMVEQSKMATCLETLHYKGSTIPDLAKIAQSMADKVCACKDSSCTDAELRAGGRVFARAFTPDDLATVRASTKRASECIGKMKK